MSLVIGVAAIGRSLYGDLRSYSNSRTRLNAGNPANENNSIGVVQAWFDTATGTVDVWVGTFYLVSGTTYTCRDSESIGSVATGSMQEYTGLGITAVTGDLIGASAKTGTLVRIEQDFSGFDGVFSVTGEYIDPSDSVSYALRDSDAISLRGESVEAGAAFIPRVMIF